MTQTLLNQIRSVRENDPTDTAVFENTRTNINYEVRHMIVLQSHTMTP